MATLKQLIESEIGDFFAGFGHPGEPETPEEMQSQLLVRVMPLLAGLEQEPVATFYKSECGNVFNTLDGWLPVEGVNNLYAAPQLPQQAVPECYQRLLSHAHGMTMGHDWNKGTMAGHHREKLCKAVEDCCAAMLQGAEPVTDNTNQQFESLSRANK